MVKLQYVLHISQYAFGISLQLFEEVSSPVSIRCTAHTLQSSYCVKTRNTHLRLYHMIGFKSRKSMHFGCSILTQFDTSIHFSALTTAPKRRLPLSCSRNVLQKTCMNDIEESITVMVSKCWVILNGFCLLLTFLSLSTVFEK